MVIPPVSWLAERFSRTAGLTHYARSNTRGRRSSLVVTLVPFLIAVALLLVAGLVPYVGAPLLLVSVVAFLLWGLWKLGANVLDLTGQNAFRLTRRSEPLFGRGGPDDPDWVLVPRKRPQRVQAETTAAEGPIRE
jgi:hypothetical protein